jgi:cytochrome P450
MADAGAFDPKMMFDFPDPYPMFADLRRTQPVMRGEFMNRVTYMLTKYDDCLAVLKDSTTYSSRSNAVVGQIMGRTLIEMDGKEHTRHRALVQPVFVPKGMDGLTAVLDGLIAELLDELVGERAVDLVPRFTERFPVQVMAHLIGVPREDHPLFQRWAIDIIGFPRDIERGIAAAAALRDYLLPVIAARRSKPRDDIISKLVAGEVEGQGLTPRPSRPCSKPCKSGR